MLRERADLAALAAMPAARRHDELARVLDYLLAAQGIAVGGARRRTLVRELADWLGGHGEHGDDAAAAVAPAPTFDVRGTGTGRAKWSPP